MTEQDEGFIQALEMVLERIKTHGKQDLAAWVETQIKSVEPVGWTGKPSLAGYEVIELEAYPHSLPSWKKPD